MCLNLSPAVCLFSAADRVEYVNRLTACAPKGFSVQYSTDPSTFLASYADAGVGYEQLPFSPVHNDSLEGQFMWMRLEYEGELVALSAVRALARTNKGQRFSDSLLDGSLYRLEVPLADGWLPGQGPELQGPFDVFYHGGGWVHPGFRGQGLVGLMARLGNLWLWERFPEGNVWLAIVSEGAFLSGSPFRDSSSHAKESSLVQAEGWCPVTRSQGRLHAVWSSQAQGLSLYQAELQALRAGGALSWLFPKSRAALQ